MFGINITQMSTFLLSLNIYWIRTKTKLSINYLETHSTHYVLNY